MSVLLTHAYFLEEDPKEKEIMRPYAPLGILSIAAWLEQQGMQVQVFDSTFSSFEKFKAYLIEHKPKVVGVYTNLMTKLNVLKIMEWIKQEAQLAGCKVVLGGPEVRNHIPQFLAHGADYLVLGEGEETMYELCHAILNKGETKHIAGIAFLDANAQVMQNAEREKIKDLDALPLPARQKIDLTLYFKAWKQKHGQSAISVSTMRGCPYTCKWCSRAVYGQSYRRRSAAKVATELKWIQENYEVDTVWFVDDVFTVSHVWLKQFTEEVKKAKVTLKYECITRADRMNEEVIQLLKESGCFRVWIGAESGSQKVIDLMDRRVDVNKVQEMIKLTQAAGMEAGTFIMVGYPGETEKDIELTIEHLKAGNPNVFTITVAYPIKGTPLYTEVEPLFVKELPWEKHTDRDIDFKRTYPRKYYDYAVRRIVNEVNAYKSWLNGNYKQFAKLWLKAKAANLLMSLSK